MNITTALVLPLWFDSTNASINIAMVIISPPWYNRAICQIIGVLWADTYRAV